MSEEDLQHLSPNELQDSYDVELAPLESIEAWINASRDLREVVNLNPNVRRSSRFRKPAMLVMRLSYTYALLALGGGGRGDWHTVVKPLIAWGLPS